MKKSGVDEQFEERERLLTDIIDLMKAYEEGSSKEKAHARMKADGIEASGLTCRRLAMGELSDEDLFGSDISDEGYDTSNSEDKKKITDVQTPKNKKKRSRSVIGSRSAKKVTKQERLAGLMDTVVKGIATMNDGKEDKKEIERIRAESAICQAKLRIEHEERQEERRILAEAKRDEKQHEFMLQLIKFMKEK